MIIIGSDPGIVNFGITVIDSIKHQVLWTGFHSAAINSLSAKPLKKKGLIYPDFATQSNNYLRVSEFHLQAWRPDNLIFERYATRNFKGINIELINIMIGLWLGLAHKYKIITRVTTAASWKNTLRAANIDLEQLYHQQQVLGIPPHLVDSLMLASFVGSEGNTVQWVKLLPYYLSQLQRTFAP